MSTATTSLSLKARKASYVLKQSIQSLPNSSICLPCRIRIQQYTFKNSTQRTPFSTSARLSETPPSSSSPAPPTDPPVTRVPDTSLPSHRLSRHSHLRKHLTTLLDRTTSSLAHATHRINTLTGTDYSAIEALRAEIAQQETLVRSRSAALMAAKSALERAQDLKAASAAELVALLERKSTWSAVDLERYMALIRSEHVNDSSIVGAKRELEKAESALEEARVRLEKRERAQYHEEQIWSDTIRRNSTWVTIGLMGLNIGILLINLVVVEPWRRKRLVGEVRSVLEDGKGVLSGSRSLGSAEHVVDTPVGVLETVTEEPKSVEESLNIILEAGAPEAAVVEETADVSEVLLVDQPEASGSRRQESSTWNQKVEAHIRNLFSNQPVVLQKVELTTIAIQSAAIGASVTGLIIYLIKPR